MNPKFKEGLFLLCALVVVVASFSTGRAADSPASSPWKEYPLGQSGDLQAVVRVKPVASMADADWLIVEITNNGPAARIKSGAVNVSVTFKSLSSVGSISGLSLTDRELGISSGVRATGSVGNLLPTEKFTTAGLGSLMGVHLGQPRADEEVTSSIVLDLKLDDGRAISGTISFTTTWTKPDGAQIPELQKQVQDLLAKSLAGPVRPYEPWDPDINPPPRLNAAEDERLAMLLDNPDIARAVTLAQLLASIKLYQQEGAFTSYATARQKAMVYEQWAKDPAVIAFYRDALMVRGGEAIYDLSGSFRGVWDDSFVEPVVKNIESAVATMTHGRVNQSRLPVAEVPLNILEHGLDLLSWHNAAWAKDAAVASRLSKAILSLCPALTGAASADSAPGSVSFYNAINWLALSRDRAMVEVLRPFLADKTVDAYTTSALGMIPAGVTPMRVCELAANAICAILGEHEMVNLYNRAKAPSGGPYPEWSEWDKKIAELTKRLDALPKP